MRGVVRAVVAPPAVALPAVALAAFVFAFLASCAGTTDEPPSLLSTPWPADRDAYHLVGPGGLGWTPVPAAEIASALETRFAPESEEGNGSTHVVALPPVGERLVYGVTQLGLLDDSISATRRRLEFAPSPSGDGTWELVWAGSQFVCWPGRGSQVWSSEFCL